MKRVVVSPVIRNEQDERYTLQTVVRFLSNGAEVRMDEKHRDMAYSNGAVFASTDELYEGAELIVVLGGDGTILRAAESALEYDLPILGINLGRLGYMAELEKDELELIDNIFSKEYGIEKRMTLSVSVVDRDGKNIFIGDALNDVVIRREKYAHCIDIDLMGDGKPVRTIRGDGLIFATPTGSTAYSMSAGGSVLDPTLECICATPIVPVSRYACPLVFSGNSVLEALHNDERVDEWSLILDGVEKYDMVGGQKVVVKKSKKFLKMLSLKDESFFETLNNKISKYELKK